MQTRDTLAVVDDTCFYTCGRKWAHEPIDCLSTLAEMAQAAGLKHIWVVVGTGVSKLANDPFIGYDATGAGDWNVTGIGQDALAYLSVRRGNQRFEDHIEIGFPEWSRWPWRGDTDPGTLLATLAYLEDALGFPVAWTPAWMSLELFKRLNANRYGWLEPLTMDLEDGSQVNNFSFSCVAKELHWPPKGQEIAIPEGATHFIRVDGNSAYNASETGLNVGEGNPTWIPPGPHVEMASSHTYDGKKPGFWAVEVFEGKSHWDGKILPRFDDRTWMTTDLIEQLRRSGHRIIVKMGWCWGTYHQTLRSFAELLWDMRVLWRGKAHKSQAHENVHESIRVLLKALHGKLARQDNAPRFPRRDIWAMVVARSVAMRVYWIEKIYREKGLIPVGIKADEFKYAVNDPHILDDMLDQDKLGGLKLVEIVEITKEA